MASTLTQRDIAEAKITIWELLAKGEPDSVIIDTIGLSPKVYGILKHQVFDDKAQELRTKPSEHVYVEYILAQKQNISDLTEMIGEFKSTKQYNAMVGAIRARADLNDKLIARGQEFGVFRKEPERRVIAGVLVAEMTRTDLKVQITGAIGNLEKMMSMYGGENIIDVPTGPIHYGRRLPPPTEVSAPVAPKAKKTARAKTSRQTKRARGRKPFKKRTDA